MPMPDAVVLLVGWQPHSVALRNECVQLALFLGDVLVSLFGTLLQHRRGYSESMLV